MYFATKVEHVKFVDFCGKYRIPFMQYLCSSTCNEKISKRPEQLVTESSESDTDDENNKILKKILLG